MSLADFAASAARSVSKYNGKRLGRKREAPPIQPRKLHIREGEQYNVGYAVSEVMPDNIHDHNYWIAGYGIGRKIEGIHDPITVRAIWVGAGTSGGYVHICADIIGLSRVDVNRVRDMLDDFCRETHCCSVNISCSHTHAGIDTVGYWGPLPRTGIDKKYQEKLLSTMADLARKAYCNRKPGRLFIGSASVPDAQLDKREPVVLHDTLTRIRFVPDDGSAETWLVNFAAHPNTLGGDWRHISADYPYYLRERVNERQNVNVLFGVGAIGAVDPGDWCEDKAERTRLQGQALGDALFTINNDRELPCRMKILRQPFYCPVDNPVLAFLASINVMRAKRYPSDQSDIGMALKTELTYIDLGGQKILTLPGESFPETIYGGYAAAKDSATGEGPEINPEPLCSICEDENLLVFGTTNDFTGYVVPPNDFVLHKTQPYLSTCTDKRGGRHYHETNSLGIRTSEMIAGTFAEMYNRMKGGDDI